MNEVRHFCLRTVTLFITDVILAYNNKNSKLTGKKIHLKNLLQYKIHQKFFPPLLHLAPFPPYPTIGFTYFNSRIRTKSCFVKQATKLNSTGFTKSDYWCLFVENICVINISFVI